MDRIADETMFQLSLIQTILLNEMSTTQLCKI